jgi:hypothetical protein
MVISSIGVLIFLEWVYWGFHDHDFLHTVPRKGRWEFLLVSSLPPSLPSWLLGIYYPISIGYEALGVWGAFGFGFVDVILPYSCWAVYNNIYNDDVRVIPCCSCFRSTAESNDPDEANDLELIEYPHVPNEADEAFAIVYRAAYPAKSTESGDSTKQLLIVKKVVNQGDLLVEKDDAKSFRFNHPKSDLVIQRQQKSNRLDNKKDKEVDTTSSDVSFNSVQ